MCVWFLFLAPAYFCDTLQADTIVKLSSYLLHIYIFRVYWPLFVLIFYVLSPIPTFISRRLSDDSDSSSNACRELAYFLTTGIVVSSFGLPIVLARNSTVSSLLFW